MRAKVTTARGDVLLQSVHAVTISDGRLGFATSPADAARVLEASEVTITAADRRVAGVAQVVRSGTAYDEVLGRTRLELGRWRAWVDRIRRGRQPAVVLVQPPG